jgi:flagellar hook protein FlgE
MTVEIAQMAALSFAVATFLPVEISDWTVSRLLLIPRRVCSATIALLFVRMLDI